MVTAEPGRFGTRPMPSPHPRTWPIYYTTMSEPHSKMVQNLSPSALDDLTSRIGHTDTVLLMVGEYTVEEIRHSGAEFVLADCIIQLAYEPRVPTDRHWLQIVKMRGRNVLDGKHTFRITADGVQVFPRAETRRQTAPPPVLSGRISIGTAHLDESPSSTSTWTPSLYGSSRRCKPDRSGGS